MFCYGFLLCRKSLAEVGEDVASQLLQFTEKNFIYLLNTTLHYE